MLRRFENTLDPDFAAALLLYARNTPPSSRTDTNEISYWLERFHKHTGDYFYVFGFYRNSELVGYAEVAYLRKVQTFALDYIVIEASQRRNNVFYEFLDHIRNYLELAHPEYRFGMAEVCYGPGQKYPTKESSLVARLLKIQGFKVARAPYFQPRLMEDNAESEMHADLLIYSPEEVGSLRPETYLAIVRAYYDYYMCWKDYLPTDAEPYRRYLDLLYSRIETGIGKQKSIHINGHKTVLTSTERKPLVTVHRVVSFAFQALVTVILLTTAMLGLRAWFNLSNSAFVIIFGTALIAFVAVAGIVSQSAREILTELLTFTKQLLKKSTASPLSASLQAEKPKPRKATKMP